MRRTAVHVGTLVSAATLLLTGCGQPEVSTDELESQVSAQLQQEVGQAPQSVTCDEALPAQVGETARCELTTADDTRYGLTVETTEVEGESVRFSIAVDEDPIG